MRTRKLLVAILGPLLLAGTAAADWPEAAGPHHDYQTSGSAPAAFSVSRNEHILWKVPLPNTGESTPVVAKGRVFLTCHTPMTADAQAGRDILALCFDASTGKELWRRELPASRTTDMASGFSDNTAASPVTDGQFVCFVNVGGSIRTYDFDGKLVWQYDWVPFGRHHARQQEPILHHGNVILLKTVAENLPVAATTKAGAKPLGRDQAYWTRLHALELSTGKLQWVAESATSVHASSLLNRTSDGAPAILTGRGGGHQPPEEPHGLSLINADSGKTIWDLPIPGYAAHQNNVWRGDRGGAFIGMQHHQIDLQQGVLQPGVSLTKNVQVRQFQSNHDVASPGTTLPAANKAKAITYHTNCLVGDFHYFRTHSDFYLGRVNLASGKVEYLQVPVQIIRDAKTETVLWDKALPNDVKNNEGFVVCQDPRAKASGWGHVSAASPIVVGEHLYMPTMLGMVYVVRWNAPALDESALVSISDLGPAGKTWTLSSMAADDGKLYARTLKELICIGD
ncbi:outer membrane protein assembly factor BamB family protein [Lignipirellula cremea]|uniref:PQQ enzyme repeat protein n=1 Tax=Lignipirellula cremea TaxID=2528010 RepID=A0A518DNZ1_9BACT|nr:PQQ-binding-like beta-propeller repeat protein [Lignipirellula cremea]QDU93556.1 PQQ enzyme repeat protein [Lignipirellula cremea]